MNVSSLSMSVLNPNCTAIVAKVHLLIAFCIGTSSSYKQYFFLAETWASAALKIMYLFCLK